MKHLLIVYHTMTGAAQQLATAAHSAAAVEADATPQLLTASAVDATHLLAADGYLFVTPENLATMAGRMKDFFDRVYYGVLDKVNGRPYAVDHCRWNRRRRCGAADPAHRDRTTTERDCASAHRAKRSADARADTRAEDSAGG